MLAKIEQTAPKQQNLKPIIQVMLFHLFCTLASRYRHWQRYFAMILKPSDSFTMIRFATKPPDPLLSPFVLFSARNHRLACANHKAHNKTKL